MGGKPSETQAGHVGCACSTTMGSTCLPQQHMHTYRYTHAQQQLSLSFHQSKVMCVCESRRTRRTERVEVNKVIDRRLGSRKVGTIPTERLQEYGLVGSVVQTVADLAVSANSKQSEL